MLSRQLPTRPLPVAPVPVELLQTELQVYLMVFILNNYLNNFMSHLKRSLPRGKLLFFYLRQRPLITADEFFLFGAQVVPPPGQCLLALGRYRQWYRREGRYLLRTNLTQSDPKLLWEYYLQLVAIEAAFKNLKDDLQIRPVFHKKEDRVEAHIFVAYLAYCLQVSLQAKLRQVAGGLTSRTVLEKFATMQMMDAFFPTKQPGKELLFRRDPQPEKDHQMLLSQLGWQLPEQPPPRISVKGELLR